MSDNISRRWRDGSLELDLPTFLLSEMFNCNHFIVSQTNPHIVPLLNLKKSLSRRWANLLELELRHRCVRRRGGVSGGCDLGNTFLLLEHNVRLVVSCAPTCLCGGCFVKCCGLNLHCLLAMCLVCPQVCTAQVGDARVVPYQVGLAVHTGKQGRANRR